MAAIDLKYPLTHVSAWGASLAYALAVAALLTGRWRWFRALWTLGLIVYWIHVAAAFGEHHQWSHSAAYQSTAHQTQELFGFYWGGGLYFNYAFTMLWTADALWAWFDENNYRHRPAWIAGLLHGFMAFLFFNATAIFGKGWIAWFGAVAAVLLSGLYARRLVAKTKRPPVGAGGLRFK